MKYTPASFGGIVFDKLTFASNPPTTNRITQWENGIHFDPDLNDYNPLDNIYDDTFYQLPYVRHTVASGEAGRPDLISFKLYGDTDFYAYILLFNRIVDPFTVEEGVQLRIPVFSNLASWLTIKLIQYPISNRKK